MCDKFLKQKKVSNNSITNNTFNSYKKDLSLFHSFLISNNIKNQRIYIKKQLKVLFIRIIQFLYKGMEKKKW